VGEEFIITKKKSHLYYILLAVVLLFIFSFVGGYLFSGRNVASERERDKEIIRKLDTAISNQQRITTQLDGISKTVSDSVKRIGAIEERIGGIEGITQEVIGRFREIDSLLAESRRNNETDKRIFQDILERNEKKNK
jgi:archaellum component FlaC